MTSTKLSHKRVELVPISQIRVVNPRSRSRKGHEQIIENILSIGLKRPITVTPRSTPEGQPGYDLICGQGRMEAFQALRQQEIPAFVTDASPEDCLVLSLVENVARRTQRPIELIREIGSLRSRGFSDARIALMIGVTPAYISMLGKLLDSGEERLLSAVEAGSISIDTALQIARASESDIQRLLADASEQGFKGRELATLRRLLEQRLKGNRSIKSKSQSANKATKTIKPAELRRFYKQEIKKKDEMAKRAESVRDRITFAVEAMRNLLSHAEFRELLDGENDIAMPEALKQLVTESGALT